MKKNRRKYEQDDEFPIAGDVKAYQYNDIEICIKIKE